MNILRTIAILLYIIALSVLGLLYLPVWACSRCIEWAASKLAEYAEAIL